MTKIPRHISFKATNPSGKYHNGAETKWMPNPLNDPELIYRAGLDDTVTRHNTDGIAVEEFMNNQDLIRSKDYVVYPKQITAEQADIVDLAIKHVWTPSLLLNADRGLSSWDAQFKTITHNDLIDTISAYIDSLNFSITNNYTSDYSSGIDGMTSQNGSGSGQENIGGESDCFKYTLSGGSSNSHRFFRGGLAPNDAINVKFRIYIPSTNAKVDGFQIRSSQIEKRSPALDTWVDYTFERLLTVAPFYFYAQDGATNTVDADGDVIYIKDLVMDIYEGDHLIQGTSTKQPVLSGSLKTSLLTLDGGDDYFSQEANPANYQDSTYFEYWGVINLDGATTTIPFSINDSGSDDDRFQIVVLGTLVQISFYKGAVFNRVQSSVISAGDHILGIICDGVKWKIYIDNVELVTALLNGVDLGEFIGHLANKANVDFRGVGIINTVTPSYFSNKEKYHLTISGTSTAAATTASERTEINNYINKRFGLGISL